MSNIINILFLGDIVGKPGRLIVKEFLEKLKTDSLDYSSNNTLAKIKSIKPDFILANVENASHGFGLTQKNYNQLLSYGLDGMTSGNHIWDRKEIFTYIDKADKLVRPLNYPAGVPGEGIRYFEVGKTKIAVINLLGRVFMGSIDSPWSVLEEEIEEIKKNSDIIILDFHAEATAEKVSMGYFADKLGVNLILGTHTHIQTSDETILENGAGYITDVGFCGTKNAVIGMDFESSIARLKTSLPQRFDVAEKEETELNGVIVSIDAKTGDTKAIERIIYVSKLTKDNSMEGS